jgi:PadR family transcriptional regulator, regulatory protein PadR
MPKRAKRQYRHLPAFILLSLAKAPRHGGAVHSDLLETMPGLKIDTGAVYRTLQELEAEGQARSAWDTSRPGPARKIYSLTPAGLDKLDDWKKDIEHRLGLLRGFLAEYAALKDQTGG